VVVEAEHGYASTMPIPDDMRTVTKRPKTKKSQGSRFVSEKNFREKRTARNLIILKLACPESLVPNRKGSC